MSIIGGILGLFLFLFIAVSGLFLFGLIVFATLILGTIFGLIRGFFFMGQALLTDVLGIGNL